MVRPRSAVVGKGSLEGVNVCRFYMCEEVWLLAATEILLPGRWSRQCSHLQEHTFLVAESITS